MSDYQTSLKNEIIQKTLENLHGYFEFEKAMNNGYLSWHQTIRIKELIDSGRILVADDTSTGKTLVGIGSKLALDKWYKKRNKAIVIVPNTAKISTWSPESIDDYCRKMGYKPQNTVHINHPYDLRKINDNTDFILINYEKFSRYRKPEQNAYLKELNDLDFDLLIMDECHNVKNSGANRTRNVKTLIEKSKGKRLLLLSATPIPNRLKDIGMVLYMLDPEKYPDSASYIYRTDPEAVSRMLSNLKWFRITKNDLKDEFGFVDPPKERLVQVELNEGQSHVYLEVWKDCLTQSDKLVKLRKILFDPNLVSKLTNGSQIPSAKYEKLDELLKDKMGRGEKVVVHSTLRTGIIDPLVQKYAEFGAVKIDGTVISLDDRVEISKKFKSSTNHNILFMTSVAEEGIDLSTGNVPCSLIRMEPPFTPREFDQTLGRIYRKGQEASVEAYTLIAHSELLKTLMNEALNELTEKYDISRPKIFKATTIDEDIWELLRYKLRIIDKVYGGENLSRFEEKVWEVGSVEEGRYLLDSLFSIKPRKNMNAFQEAIWCQSFWEGIGENAYRKVLSTPRGKEYPRKYETGCDASSPKMPFYTNQAIAEIVIELEQQLHEQFKIVDLASGPALLARTLDYAKKLQGNHDPTCESGSILPTACTVEEGNSDSSVICVDLDKKMLEIGKKRCKKLHIKSDFIEGSIRNTGLPDESFEVAVCSYAYHHLKQNGDEKEREIEDAAIEANRILKTGGHYIIALQHSIDSKNTENIRKGLERYGFSDTKISGSYCGFYSNTKGRTYPFNLIVARKVKECDRSYNGSPEEFKLRSMKVKLVTTKQKNRKESQSKGTTKFCKSFVRESDSVGLKEIATTYSENLKE